MNNKECTGCNQVKSTEQFSYSRNTKDGLRHRCRECCKAYHYANRERILAKKRERWQENADAINAERRRARAEDEAVAEAMRGAARRSYAKHKDQRTAYAKAYREAKPEVIAARNRAYVEANRESVARQKKAWRENNLERVRAHDRQRAKEYRADEKNKPELRARRLNRLAREAKASGTHTPKDVEILYRSQGGVCAYCETELGGVFHVDHMVPLSRGGSNWPENLAVTCPSCNSRKQSQTAEEFMMERMTGCA